MKKAGMMKSLKKLGKDFLREETAVGVIEMILILVEIFTI